MSVRLELDLSRLGNANECSTVMALGEPEVFARIDVTESSTWSTSTGGVPGDDVMTAYTWIFMDEKAES